MKRSQDWSTTGAITSNIQGYTGPRMFAPENALEDQSLKETIEDAQCPQSYRHLDFLNRLRAPGERAGSPRRQSGCSQRAHLNERFGEASDRHTERLALHAQAWRQRVRLLGRRRVYGDENLRRAQGRRSP